MVKCHQKREIRFPWPGNIILTANGLCLPLLTPVRKCGTHPSSGRQETAVYCGDVDWNADNKTNFLNRHVQAMKHVLVAQNRIKWRKKICSRLSITYVWMAPNFCSSGQSGLSDTILQRKFCVAKTSLADWRLPSSCQEENTRDVGDFRLAKITQKGRYLNVNKEKSKKPFAHKLHTFVIPRRQASVNVTV